MDNLDSLLRCPRCLSPVERGEASYRCTGKTCPYGPSGVPFPVIGAQPVLIDFAESLFDREFFTDGCFSRPPGGSELGSTMRQRAKRVLRRILRGENAAARRMSARFMAEAKAVVQRPRVLVVGGGTMGSGAEALYDDPGVTLVGTDVFASPLTVVVSDAHRLPFPNESFDGVCIQAVLEHVLDPHQVVAQIHRVLKPEGLVYAGTPFMQQVHMGAYDFTRFTLSGHRWLFRRFEQIEAGASGGAGVATIWSIRYLVRAIGAGPLLAGAIAAPFFWLRFFDRIARPGANADAASGTYFFGRKSTRTLMPKDMPAYYETGGGA